jgi:hypothetical protein
MEYKPPFSNQPPKYRYFLCSMGLNEEWLCVRCEDEHRCFSAIPGCQSQKSRLVSVSDDIPEYLDKLIVMSKLNTRKIEMKK